MKMKRGEVEGDRAHLTDTIISSHPLTRKEEKEEKVESEEDLNFVKGKGAPKQQQMKQTSKLKANIMDCQFLQC